MSAQIKYGLQWPEGTEDWQIELKMYQFPHLYQPGHKLKQHDHFIRAAQMLWGDNNTKAQFKWHPWAVDMAITCCAYSEVGLCGPASCGKSEFSAIWVILNWLCDPAHTLFYVTSTTIPRAKQKIWGAIERYFLALPPHVRAAGKLVANPTPTIWTEIGGNRISTAGIHLVAAAASQGREAANKLQGSKANAAPNALSIQHPGHSRCGLMADELSDLAHAILAATSNLKSNTWSSVVAAANPRHKLDPFSILVEPEGGWDSINVDTSSWRTKRGGICLHFDDLKSPNLEHFKKYLEDIANGKKREEYVKPWPIKCGSLIQHEIDTGDIMSPEFWRNFRGFWSPLGEEATIISHDDVKITGADTAFKNWNLTKQKIRVMGVDSSFSTGGDRTIAVIVEMGWCSERRCQVVEIIGIEEINVSMANKDSLHSEQVGLAIKQLAHKYAIQYTHIGFDATVIPAADALASALKSNEFYRVGFGTAATDTPISDLDPTPAKEKYGNRVTELWFFGKELLRHRQLFGITDELTLELIVRQYKIGKAGAVSRLYAESKRDMKTRTGGRSPDTSDALMIALDLLRQKHGLRTASVKFKQTTANGGSSDWLNFTKRTSSVRAKYKI